MKRWFCLASAATLFLCIAASLQAQPSAPHDTRFQSLRPDSSFSDWRRLSLEGGARPFDTGAAYVQTLPGDPLGLNAPETTSGYWRPLSQSLSSLVETSFVPGSLGMSERSVMGQLGTQLGSGWAMQAGIRHSDLGVAAPEANKPTLGLGLTSLPAPAMGPGLGADLGHVDSERYWDRYRGATRFLRRGGRRDRHQPSATTQLLYAARSPWACQHLGALVRLQPASERHDASREHQCRGRRGALVHAVLGHQL